MESFDQWKARKQAEYGENYESYMEGERQKIRAQVSKKKEVKAQNLSQAIDEVIGSIIIDVECDCAETLAKVGRDTVKELKATSPVNTGKYAKSWKYKVEGTLTGSKLIVYNSKSPMTHLLENGHLTRDGISRTKPNPHIKNANDNAQKEALELLADIMR